MKIICQHSLNNVNAVDTRCASLKTKIIEISKKLVEIETSRVVDPQTCDEIKVKKANIDQQLEADCTKSDRWVSSGHSGFLPHEDHQNAIIGANEHD